MNLTAHFTLAELTASAKARALGLDNTPPADVLPRLVLLAEMLERIRATLGEPITVTSGYRSPAVNRAVGGITNSDHTLGLAADIVGPAVGTPYVLAKRLAPLVQTLCIGQLILEGMRGKQWLHVSTRAPAQACNRVITITDAGTQPGIQELA